jgi:hypothetical protein
LEKYLPPSRINIDFYVYGNASEAFHEYCSILAIRKIASFCLDESRHWQTFNVTHLFVDDLFSFIYQLQKLYQFGILKNSACLLTSKY